MDICDDFRNYFSDILTDYIRFGDAKYSFDLIVAVLDNSHFVIITRAGNNTCVGVLSVLQSVIINKLLAHHRVLVNILSLLKDSLAFLIVVHDILKEVSVDLQTFDMIWIHFIQHLELGSRNLDLIRDLAAQVLQLLDIRTVFQQLSPEVKVVVNSFLDKVLEKNEFVLEVYDDIHIHAFRLSGSNVVLNHFFFDDILVAMDRELFLHVWLVLFRDHHLEERLVLVFELLVLDVSVEHM
mmetsp:Transcript_58142/g.66997  ORF Transcript_58142/g.66997 Transcript_58142/m.66997 type:complete len:239 (-) Transcript_58142:1354-2070(-)